MFTKRRDARRDELRNKWQQHLDDNHTDRTDPEAIRAALLDFIITNRVRRSDADWIVFG